ncbi:MULTISPECIES: coniferyl aldehyde dehydrogenase [Pseudomonas]|uniref:Aldehyde dehydrogenase n=4 Tax=Pseudomonas TaxID=286 RepID=A0A267D6Q9_PSEFR|nr:MULTISPECIES: coniferyl aldehyde dehydrogenase [Pseudomonas]MDA7021296.1 coniferyl aldehyde dehydrogenase [Pseudomonas fragi]MDY7569616.1 coniferyl aldehyde dehydrogenase [Pseudomonas sp. CCC4.1]MEB0142720.1 coniferyl aldehyde dehydrogenase [Pseudomonas sp. CCC4.1]MQT85008.1 aldehyde dehydrogenase family protein [Pseudomonas sp. FSL R10-2964]MQU55749.1 aldehyde dehydrogenase family protein [Pseudomonas sp. FSL R10-1339]
MTFSSTAPEQLTSLLAAQKKAFVGAGHVSAELRRERIQRVIELLVRFQQPLVEAMDADFGGRPQGFSLMNDVLGSLASLKYARDHLEHWVADEPRQVFAPYDQLGAKAWVMHQPKGSIGILGTWNAPLFTLLSPLACVLAAGNRAILKPSEVVPRTADVLAGAFAELFDPLEIAVVTGDAELAQVFTAQAFDHLVFTGSTAVARSVMRNAAQNLVPLTLELGGKSPVIISRSADLAKAAFSIAVAKANNGGQICINPDVVYVPREQMEDFLGLLGAAYSELLPATDANPDVVAVVNDRHLQRIEGYVQDARQRGARVERFPRALEVDALTRRRPLQVVINPPRDSLILQEEIFGPALVLLPYEQLDRALADIHSRERPLALYYFGQSEEEQRHVLQNTISGGVSINDVMMHAALHDAPFGGIGASGMGHYHGREGFLEFSHMRTVYKAAAHDPRREWGLLPPYGEHFLPAMQAMVTAD